MTGGRWGGTICVMPTTVTTSGTEVIQPRFQGEDWGEYGDGFDLGFERRNLARLRLFAVVSVVLVSVIIGWHPRQSGHGQGRSGRPGRSLQG